MIYIVTLLNISCIVITILTVLRDNKNGRVPLFSLRNVFLAGYLYFQSLGFFSWIFDRQSNGWWHLFVADRNYQSSLTFGLMLNLFLLVFLLTYRFAPIRFELRKLQSRALQNPQHLVRLAIILSALSIVIWILGQFFLKDLMRYISAGIGVTATGLATWAWAYKIRNPVYLSLVVAIAMVNLAPHLTEYGRRGIVSVAAIIAWVLFYRVAFKFNPIKVAIVTLIVGMPMLVVMAAFSEARVKRPESTSEAISYMMNADLERGFRRLATFQGSAPISIWCIENFPRPYKYRHCYTAKALVWFFVPRAVWPEKPPGLGTSIPSMSGMRRVGGLNVGAGLIGHASAEGGWYALVLYAIIISLGLKLLDAYAMANPTPLVQIPVAAALGDLFATARGEVNYFLDIMIISVVSGFIFAFLVNRLMTSRKKY